MEEWLATIKKTRIPLYTFALQSMPLSGIGVEIGCGSSAFSITASQQSDIRHITCVDNNVDRLKEAELFFTPKLQGSVEKLSFIQADFHSLPLSDHALDFVLADAALHHTEDLHALLAEIKRVLKPAGTLVAVREPILPSLLPLKLWRKLWFGWRQRLRGDTECTHTKQEWIDHFNRAGFKLQLQPSTVPTTLKEKIVHTFARYNGILFGRYILIATQ